MQLVGNQSIFFEKLEIFPTQIALYLDFPESNTHEIFRFDDIRIEDVMGNIWSNDGIHIIKGSKTVLYFESNYFSEPEELKLKFSSIRTLPKDQLKVVVDLKEDHIIQAPHDGKIKKFYYDKKLGGLFFDIEVDKRDGYSFFQVFEQNIYDAQGEMHGNNSFSVSNLRLKENILHQHALFFDENELESPITLTIVDYPSRIREEVTLKIK
ncbi:DUF5643 domain-containing protein [Sutcliffiella rhizosphaerae]|uniref:DUF5643 domain-containing protein n=1 Tax=Sutcliffiella rhizosphaerae TaxID=2880967 RepID=A0ABN8A9V8_9BACI|nr:DUF5643 domain-containing protein [Sutcliffiella rhizosphaerae]CAG9620661.1 hypothetical protein BACCIP111883_01430 [Sutcliffiella rhizosphaerae]